jgi:hypothetical protein
MSRGATTPPPSMKNLPAPARGQSEGQVRHPDLPLGRHVAHRHLGPQARRRLRLHGRVPHRDPTNVDGIQLGELFPNLAKQADKFSLIRSMTHRNNGHETAAYLMQTAHAPGERLAYPSVGAVFSHFSRARPTKA